MLWYTHLAFGFLSALVFMPSLSFFDKIVFFSLVLIGALMPDIDAPNSKINNYVPWLLKPISWFTKHRGVFHSLFGALLLSGLIYYFISETYGFALFLGYVSHLVIDGFTKEGINFLHPITTFRLSGFIETGKIAEHVVLIAIVLGSLLIIF